MEIVVKKSYVEKLYRGFFVCDSAFIEISERDPMKVENDGIMEGFRFFDKKFFINGKNIGGLDLNYSNWIYFGKRMSLAQVKELYGSNPDYRVLINNMENNKDKYVCHTQNGSFLIMEKGDMTYDEIVIQKELEKEIKAKAMFDKLREHIGEEVSYTAWLNGIKRKKTEKLIEVNDFSNVVIGIFKIPFVESDIAISNIISKNGEVLYLNPYIGSSYDIRTDEEVFDFRKLIFGNRTADMQQTGNEIQDRVCEENNSKDTEKVRTKK